MTPTELKAHRIALGLSRRDFAIALGLSPANGYNYIDRMENGRTPISARVARQVSAMTRAKSGDET